MAHPTSPAGFPEHLIRVSGVVDCANNDRLTGAVREALAAGHRSITVDLRLVRLIDAATVGALLACRRSALARGGNLRIVNDVGNVARVLDLTDTRRLLCAAPSRASRQKAVELIATSAALIDRARALIAESQRLICALNARSPAGRRRK